MNPDVLEQLKDIHQSAPVGWWPLAWGWWVLLISTVVLLILTVYWIRQYKFKRVAKKQSLVELTQLTASEAQWVVKAHTTLRRACLSYYPTQQVAKLHGEAWLNFLLNQLPEKQKTELAPALNQLVMSQYVPQTTPLEFDSITRAVKQWIKLSCPAPKPNARGSSNHV